MLDIYSPRRSLVVVNDVELTNISTMLYVGTGGDITLQLADDVAPVLLKSVPTGTVLHLRVRKVLAAGTGASNIVAFY